MRLLVLKWSCEEQKHINQHLRHYSNLLDNAIAAMKQVILYLLFLCIFGTNSYTIDTSKACVTLYLSLPKQVFFADSLSYEDSISSYAYIGTRLRPTCLAKPKTASDVAIITRVLGKFPSVQFAIRGGGHNTNRGTLCIT